MIDLRSDTVTTPTPNMRRAMAEAAVGDDVYGEDPTVNKLEDEAAALLGKEASLFLPSGTMANQVAVMTHTRPGDEVLVEAEAHIYYYEVGGIARLSGAQPRPIGGKAGRLQPDQVKAALRPADIHFPNASLLCVENTHNRAGGAIWTAEEVAAVADVAHAAGLKVHMDGARVFNAAVALGTPVSELVQSVDSIMFCLSKGLAAPMGSMLVGSREFIDRARKNRKLLGGGLRQVGVVAAAGRVALQEMIDRLADDHENARLLQRGLSEVAGLMPHAPSTNMVMVDVVRPGLSAADVGRRLKAAGVLTNAVGPQRLRLVTHKDVSREDCERAITAFAEVVSA